MRHFFENVNNLYRVTDAASLLEWSGHGRKVCPGCVRPARVVQDRFRLVRRQPRVAEAKAARFGEVRVQSRVTTRFGPTEWSIE